MESPEKFPSNKDQPSEQSEQSKRVSEINELLKDKKDEYFEKFKEMLDECVENPIKYLDPDRFYVFTALRMDELDEERFKNRVGIPEKQWKVLVDSCKKSKEKGGDNRLWGYGRFLVLASSLKFLDEERFNRDIKIDDEYWNKIVSKINQDRKKDIYLFCLFYSMAHFLNSQKIKEKLPINKDDWERIEGAVKKAEKNIKNLNFDKIHEIIQMAVIAQKIKPEDFPEITISSELWNKAKEELEQQLKEIEEPDKVGNLTINKVFQFANLLKAVKVK